MAVFSLLCLGLFGDINVDSLTAALHVETGMAYLDQGLFDEAYLEFTRALEISDTAEEAYLGLGRVSAILGSWDAAEYNYLEYMELKPFDYHPALELSEMLLDFPGRLQDASMYAGMALALAPLDGRCRLSSANVKAAQGRTEEAVSGYSLIIDENPEYSSLARISLGRLLYSTGDLTGAREVLLPAALSGEAEAHRLLCLVYLDQNDMLRAGDSANRYLFLEPNGNWADSARTILEDISFQSFHGNTGE